MAERKKEIEEAILAFTQNSFLIPYRGLGFTTKSKFDCKYHLVHNCKSA
jgi:hypothetical protein